MDVIYVSNTGVIELTGLTDETTGLLINDATVTARLQFCGVDVSGQTWPLIMDHIVDSPLTATYIGLLEADLEIRSGQQYTAIVTAISGSMTGTWNCKVLAQVRPCA